MVVQIALSIILGGEFTLSAGQEDGSLKIVATGKTGLPGFPLLSKDDVLIASDVNGDGLSDLIALRQHSGLSVVLLSDGIGGFSQEFQSGVGLGTVNFDFAIDRLFPVDIDGDGAADLFAYKAGAGRAAILKLSAGSPHVTFSSTSGISGLSDLQNPSDLVVAGDWNGDGIIDLLAVRGGEMHFALGKAATDVVARIIDGQGQRIEISYGALSSTDVYKRGTGATYPEMDLCPPRLVVTAWIRKDDATAIDNYRLKYEGLKLSLDGRGLSGFRQVEMHDLNSGLTVRTTFNQSFPFKTLPERVETWDAKGKRISITENTWATTRSKGIPQASPPAQPSATPLAQPSAAAALSLNLSFMSIVSSIRELSALKQPDMRGITYFVYNRMAEERFYDDRDALMGSRKMESQYDEFGNRINFKQEDSSGASTTTTIKYANDTARWIVGLPTEITTVGNKPGHPPNTRKAFF